MRRPSETSATTPHGGLNNEQVDAVLASPAAGALFAALDTGAQLGQPMPRVLRALIAQRPVDHPDDPARDLAAVLHARVTDWLQNTESAQAASFAGLEALIGRSSHDIATVHPDLRRALRHVDALIQARLDDLLQRPDHTGADTLGPAPDDPAARAEWKHHARIVAACHDLEPSTPSRSPDPREQAAARRRRLLAEQANAAARSLSGTDHEGTPYR